MDLVVISGFLGSGKTTLLLALAKHFSAGGKRVAVIENEVGNVGIDGALLSAEGLPVREIYAGCICCSLRHDLIQTLLALERGFAPELVFLEPSGVASPRQIQQALNGYGGEIDSRTLIVVADAERLPAITDFSMPLIHDGLEIADLVVINKVDTVSAVELAALRERIDNVRRGVAQCCVSAHAGEGVAQVVEVLEARLHARKPHGTSASLHTDTELPEASIFAATFDVATPPVDLVERLGQAMHDFGLLFPPGDGVLIGHIKAIVKSRPLGYAVFSVTECGKMPTRKGKLPERLESCSLTLNAIVYGVAQDVLDAACMRRFQALETELSGGA